MFPATSFCLDRQGYCAYYLNTVYFGLTEKGVVGAQKGAYLESGKPINVIL
jgi:hypothetical protein